MQSGGAQVDKQSKPVRKVAGSTGTRTWPPLTRKLPCVTAATETRYFTPICGAAESLHSVRKVPHTPFSFSKAAKSPHSVRKVQHLPPLPSPFFTFLSPRQQNHRSVRKIHLQLPHPPTRPPFFNFFSPKAARSPHSVMVKQILPHAFSMQSLHIVHNFHPQPFMAVKTNKNPFMPCFVSGKITTQRDDETELFSPWTYKSIIFTPRLLHNIHPAFCGWQKQTTFMPCFVGGRITTV